MAHPPMQPLELLEWEELSLKENPIDESSVKKLLSLADRHKQRLKSAEQVLTKTTTPGLKAGPVVGFLSVPGVSIEILPKISGETYDVRQALVHMIATAFQLPISTSDLAAMSAQHRDLLEILIGVFANRLREASRRGLPHRYRQREEDLPLLRGKLNSSRQMLLHVTRADRLACQFDELSVDTPLNRVLKATVKLLQNLVRRSSNERLLNELSARFDLVSDSFRPLQEPVRLDRTNTLFHHIYQFARLFLTGNWQNTTAGSMPGIALLFKMNDLFELFVGQSIKRAIGANFVTLQCRSEFALQDRREGIFNLRPDIIVNGHIVVDTKWKVLSKEDDRLLGVSQSDVYQMLAYSQAYDATRLVLLYPWHEKLGEPGIHRRWTVSGTDVPFEIASVDVSKYADVPHALGELLG
ncbi:MAG: restriction endonuclease [Gammaproteobacteria bacterium]|nr:restriction endonuclease [Gammaproteobacteria bacterium]